MALRALNATGSSVSSSPVAVTIPGVCSGPPQPPANVLAYKVGNVITVLWDPPATGGAPTSYTLLVSGGFVGSFPTTGRPLSGAVALGSYTLSVSSNSPCGASVPTTPQTVTIP